MVVQKINSLEDRIERIEGDSINIVLYCNEDYIKYMSVTLLSILEHCSQERIYDILILIESEIALDMRQKLDDIVARYRKISVRLIVLGEIVSVFDRCKSKGYHISTCFRLYVMTPLFAEYSKIITMDCDMICKKDLQELFDLDTREYILAASYEIDARWKVRSIYPIDSHYGIHGSKNYFYQYIGINDVRNYFCAGILLWNLTKVREENHFWDIVYDLKIKSYIFPDQDLLNFYYEGKTLDIGLGWNHVNYELRDYERYLTDGELGIFREQRKLVYVIHYAGHKPWNKENVEDGKYFWEYARQSPWFGEIRKSQRENIERIRKKDRHKEFVGKILPEGSLRKNFFRYVLTEFYRISK